MNRALQMLVTQRAGEPGCRPAGNGPAGTSVGVSTVPAGASHARGPRGGNVQNPELNPEARHASFNATPTANGTLGLHRKNGADGWHDSCSPGRLNEQPWHRMAAYMMLQKRTNSEIAMAAGVTPQTVSHLRAQRWFHELLATLENEAGEAVLGLMHGEAVAAFSRLAELAESGESERVRLTANLAIIEHAVGKPTQKIISSVHHQSSDPVSEYEEIQKQLAEVRAIRERTAGGNGGAADAVGGPVALPVETPTQ